MVASAVEALDRLLAATTSTLDHEITIECKHFFSGAAAYANGRIFMTLTSAGVALKLPRDSHAELIRRGAKPLRYFPRAPVKKDYLILPAALVQDTAALAHWVRNSARFCQSFPAPRRGSKRPRRPKK